ncbi:Ig-like domain-containing protein, partial [Flavisphingomonas formosensis]
LTYTPNANFNGTDTISYTISDGQGGFSTASITVTVAAVNDAPTTTGLPGRSDSDAEMIVLPVAPGFSDIDGDALQFDATGLPPGLTIDQATGVITGMIASDASQTNGGVYIVAVTAEDGQGGTVVTSFTWRVGNIPPLPQDDVATTVEDTPVTIDVLVNDNDPDGDPLTPTSLTINGVSNGTAIVNADGSITFTPTANFNGIGIITYTLGDDQGGFSTATVVVTVTPANDAPTSVGLPSRIDSDGEAVSLAIATAFSDIDDDTLSFTADGLPAGLSIDAITGRITGMIAASASVINGGIYTVKVTGRDPSGASTSQSFTWTITNPAPDAVNDTASTNEDTPVTITVLGNDTDADGDLLTVTLASATRGTVVINTDGTLTYTPNADFNGTDTISYTISDGQGGFSTASVTVTVGAINDAPVAVAPLPPRNDADGELVNFNVATDFADPDGEPLRFAATGLPNGLTIDAVTGVVTGTIASNASQIGGGVYTVTVIATDVAGASTSQSFTWTITNPAPDAVNDTASTNEDTPVTITVLGND